MKHSAAKIIAAVMILSASRQQLFFSSDIGDAVAASAGLA